MFGATVSTPLPLLLEVPLRLRLGLRLVPRYRYCLEFRALRLGSLLGLANNAVSLARPILLNERFLVIIIASEASSVTNCANLRFLVYIFIASEASSVTNCERSELPSLFNCPRCLYKLENATALGLAYPAARS